MDDLCGRTHLPVSRAGRLIALTAAAICVLAGAAFASDDIEAGRALAERLCARCHMAPGQGEKQGANDIPGFSAIARRRNQTHAVRA